MLLLEVGNSLLARPTAAASQHGRRAVSTSSRGSLLDAGQSGHTCGPPRPTPPAPPPCLQGDARGISYEDSKYLGGDVAHTHLVKGLDFALLQKVGGWWAWGGAGAVKQGHAGASDRHGLPVQQRAVEGHWCNVR